MLCFLKMRGEVGEVGTSEVAKAHTKSISILMGTELRLQGRITLVLTEVWDMCFTTYRHYAVFLP